MPSPTFCGYCPPACAVNTVDTSDLISVLIQVMLNLNRADLTLTDLTAAVQAEYPELKATELEVEQSLAQGCKRGIFFRVKSSLNAEPTYLINAKMTALNPKNALYSRPPCQLNGFWAPS